MSKLSQDERDALPARRLALRKRRKEPIGGVAYVQAEIVRFNQVKGVTDEERDQAWERITKAAKKHGVEVRESSRCGLTG